MHIRVHAHPPFLRKSNADLRSSVITTTEGDNNNCQRLPITTSGGEQQSTTSPPAALVYQTLNAYVRKRFFTRLGYDKIDTVWMKKNKVNTLSVPRKSKQPCV